MRGFTRLMGGALTGSLFACDGRASTAETFAGEPTVVEDTALRFPSGRRMEAHLYGLRYHGRFPDVGTVPVVVVSGMPCDDCDINRRVYVLRADGPRPWEEEAVGHRGVFAYPGRQLDYNGGAPVAESRLFFGRCLGVGRPAVVQFATEYEGSRTKQTASITEVAGDSLADRTLTAALPPLEGTLARVRRGECQEIPPQDLTTEP
jgi:hypothetical protein